MRIDSATSAALLGSLSRPATVKGVSDSLFGPDFLLSLGGAANGSVSLGAVDLLGSISTPDSGLYQFDPGIALGKSPAPAARPVSEAAAKAERAALTNVLGLIANKNFDAAEQVLNDLAAANPTSGAVHHTYGALALERGDYARAEVAFRKAAYFDPEAGYEADAENARILRADDTEVLKRARTLLASDGRSEDGIRLLVNLTERTPGDAAARMTLADALLRSGKIPAGIEQYARAIENADAPQLTQLENRFRELIEIAPQASYAHRLLGRTLIKQGQFDDAARSLSLATQLSGENPDFRADEALAQVGLGRTRLAQKDLSGALAAFERAKELAPSSTDVRLAYAEGLVARGDAQGRTGKLKAAVQDYKRAATELGKEGSAELRSRLAQGAYAVGVKLDALRSAAGASVGDEAIAFQTAYDLEPTSSKYRDKLAATRKTLGDERMTEGKFAEAAAAYERAYLLVKTNTTFRDLTINAYRQDGAKQLSLNKFNEAVTAYKKAFDLDRSNEMSKSGLADAYYKRGLDYRDKSQYRSAATDFREALALYPENPDFQHYFDLYKSYLT